MTEQGSENLQQDSAKVADRSWVKFLPGVVRRRLENRHVFQAAMENSGWLVADKILRMGIGLLVGVWVARYLGPSQYGIMSYAASMVGLAAAVATLGIDSIVIRDLVRHPEKSDEYLGTSFVLRFIAGLVSYVAVMVVVALIKPNDLLTQIVLAIVGWSLAVNAFDVADFWFQSKVMSKYVVYARGVGFVAAAVVRVILILYKAPLPAFAAATLAEIALGGIALLYACTAQGATLRKWKFSFLLAKELLITGWPVLLGSIVSVVCLRIDQVMLGQISDSKELGVYAAAVRVAEVWFFIPTAIIGSVFPSIIRARDVDEKEFHSRLQRLYKFLAFAGYAVAIPVTFVSPIVIKLLYGDAYAAAAPMLILLIWSDMFINLGMARNAYLFATNLTWSLFWVNVVAAVANVSLNLLLIPRLGGVGAAVASLVSYWLSAHGVCYLIKPLRQNARMMTRSLLWPKFW